MKPAPVLVAALQIHVCRVFQIRAPEQDGGEARPGVEPDIQDIVVLHEGRPLAFLAGRAGREKGLGRIREPAVGAILFEPVRHAPDHRSVEKDLVAGGTVEGDDGHTPGPLPGDTPVRPILDHGVDAFTAPMGDPFDFHDVFQGLLPQAVRLHGDEPLLRGPEDDRLLAPPAVGVRMCEPIFLEQCVPFAEQGGYACIGVENELALEGGRVFREPARVVHGCQDVQAVTQTDLEVLLAVAGRGMNATRSLLQGHVISEDDDGIALVKGVAAAKALPSAARQASHHLVGCESKLFHDRLDEVLGHHETAAVGHLDRCVGIGRVEGHGEVRRDGPRGRGPDQDRGLVPREIPQRGGGLRDEREPDVDRRRGVVMVFHLGLRQGGPAPGAPVDGLSASIDAALVHQGGEFPDDLCNVPGIHGEIGILPDAENAQPLESPLLKLDELTGVGPALLPNGRYGKVLLPFPEHLVDLVFDRQPVAVPARHVGAVPASHEPLFDDDILEDLVQCRPRVNASVRIGRAVVEDELVPSPCLFPDPFVKAGRFPPFQEFRLPLAEPGLHRELRLREVQRGFVPFGVILFSRGSHILRLSVLRGTLAAAHRGWGKTTCSTRKRTKNHSIKRRKKKEDRVAGVWGRGAIVDFSPRMRYQSKR